MTEQERLAAYDRLNADLLKERNQVLDRLEAQRAVGNIRGAAHQQLLVQKLTVRNPIARFASCGIRQEDRS